MNYQKVTISACNLLSLMLTPRCCRSPHLDALAKMMRKAENKLHRELDIGRFLKKLRDTGSLVNSFMTGRGFNPESLYQDYQYHYSNVVDIGLTTERSIEEEYALPLCIDHYEPNPACVCPDLAEVSTRAYNILKSDKELNIRME